ncbi:MAG: hypothetical protein NTW07_10380 [candidate division Zixibacteria bacterium]|nr:hypothetical protein [candidate division Zixibacteria bacterium]
MRNLLRFVMPVVALCSGVACPTQNLSAQAIVADHASVGQFTQIPQSVLDQIRSSYSFYYAHTSHGSQLITGMNMLAAENAAYAKPSFYEISDDSGAAGSRATLWRASTLTCTL